MPTPTELFDLAEQKKRDAERAAQKKENEKSATLYQEALTKYQEALDAKPRGFADAGYQIALFYKKRLLPELPGKSYHVLILEYLESTILKISKNRKKSLLTKLEQELNALLKEPGLTLPIKDRIFSALVSVNSKKGDRTQLLKLLSQWVLSEGTDAVQALFKYVQDKQPNNNEVRTLLFFLKKDTEEEKHYSKKTLAVIYHAIALCNIEQLPSTFISDEKRIVDDYNLEDIKSRATILYEQLVEEENDPIYLGRILQYLNELKLQRTDIVNKIVIKINLSPELQSNFQLLYELIRYYLDNNISNQVLKCFEILSEKPEFLDKKFKPFHDKFLSLCDEFDKPAQKQVFQQKLDALYHSEGLSGGAELDENDSQANVIDIDRLVDAAMLKDSMAMRKLKTFTQGDKKHPYALAKYADVLEAVGNLCVRTKRTPYSDPFDYVKNTQKDELNDLRKQSRQIYEQQIKEGDPVACKQVADWRMFDNQLFSKNYFIARRLYEMVLEGGQINARQKLIDLYFYGKGGPVDFIKTLELLQLEEVGGRLNAELMYIFGEISLLEVYKEEHNKAYQGLEKNRLRPQYGADGRAHRTTAGATALIISQLSDFTSDRHNHIPAMNSANRISIEELIIHERESTFFSVVESDRVKFWHLSKYPSFHRDRYYRTFHFNYGFTEPLYKELRKLILSAQPHSHKRRLTNKLIDEYLSTYRSFYLWRLSHRKLAEQHDWTLFYRDRYGNFSLTPTEEITPLPNGDSDRTGLLRFWTYRHREKVKRTEPSIVHDEISNPNDEDADLVSGPNHRLLPVSKTPHGQKRKRGVEVTPTSFSDEMEVEQVEINPSAHHNIA